MAKARAKRSKLRRYGIIALVVLCAVLIVNEIFGQHGIVALRRQKRDMKSLEQRIQQLQRDNVQLEMQINALKSDPKTIEKRAREQLHMARPNERIYVLPDKQPETSPIPQDAPSKR
jgi:cell division protein FtsB